MRPSAADPAAEAPARTRRRGEELKRAIFAAVLEELRSTGYANLTMESVAAAAGTGKSALYRRWPDKEAMVRDALRDTLPDPDEVPRTGDTRTDLVALLRFLQAVFNRTSGTLFQAVASEVGSETGFMRALVNDHVVAPCKVRIREVLRTALAEGGDPADDLDLLAEVGPAMLTHRCLTGESTISDRYVEDVVDVVLARLTGHARPERPEAQR
ncbi:TetR/AcrR family transcriptional regulator [Nocardiopsis sp. RSe5-2]|uniref:TetR/AcrR family transcriptional regulator n=1 Tax=Nocardiopsis endophytica TaxID=3018445 RepID=A0ABT4UAI3_9ACTN|nr:TetR/AcrR family transcriptional regulator [Nocardiopsis endophytica]MDA2813969.1 TetR/AcrR family transcriptional regulator [Nocardiopsis endophytica]